MSDEPKKQPGRRPRKKASATPKSDATMLQILPKQNGGQNAKSDEVRDLFYLAFEHTCGNISASCEYAGIDRATYYRWIQSDLPENVEFQNKLKEIRPVEKLLDLAEAALQNRIRSGDIRAITYALDKLGAKRGYIEKNNNSEHSLISRAVERIINTIETVREQRPDYKPNISKFVELAANDFGVAPDAIARQLEKRLEEAKQL